MSDILPPKKQRRQNGWKQANYETAPLFTGRSDLSVRKCVMFGVMRRRRFTPNTMGESIGQIVPDSLLGTRQDGRFHSKVSPVEMEMYN